VNNGEEQWKADENPEQTDTSGQGKYMRKMVALVLTVKNYASKYSVVPTRH
jgi:hypothetical protein